MPPWLARARRRIRAYAAKGQVQFTRKAAIELDALDLGLSEDDGIAILADLRLHELAGRLPSHDTHEWLYVLRPVVAGVELYLKVALRTHCVVVSFHEDD